MKTGNQTHLSTYQSVELGGDGDGGRHRVCTYMYSVLDCVHEMLALVQLVQAPVPLTLAYAYLLTSVSRNAPHRK